MKNHASATAHLVGRCVALLHDHPELGTLVAPAAAEAGRWFAEEYRGWWGRFVPRAWDRAVTFALANAAVPGIVVHYALRKRCIEDAARAAIAGGARRLIVLGGGFDTLALRLARDYPALDCTEIDHPSTQAVKRRALTRRGATPTNLRFVAADFRRQTAEDLLRALPRDGTAFVVCEGVLMYLDVSEVGALFDAVARYCGGEFAFTFMEPGPDGAAWFPGASSFVSRWLRAVGEPFAWGIRRDDLRAFAASHGFAVRAIVATHLATTRVAEGELVGLATTT